jgi:clan AA aspartic protease
MTSGRITEEGEAAVHVTVRHPDEDSQRHARFEAVIDTGFNGALTLPRRQIEARGLRHIGADQVQLGDGSLVDVELFGAVIIIEERERELLIEQAPTVPLIGTKLLWAYGLRIDFEVGGRVEVEALT